MASNKKRENFGSKFAYVMAMAGSAIGLGNIWRFPYMVGEYGGAAFIVIYIAFCILISMPIFFCEAVIGRRARQSAYGAFKVLAPGSKWKYIGVVTVVTAFVIVSYYSVVGGWSFDYLVRSCTGALNAGTRESAAGIFGTMSSSVLEPLIAFTIFLGATAFIISRGVTGGIERFTKFATPTLGILIFVIAVYSLTLPGAGAGVEYLLKPDWSKVTGQTLSFALGQSFYSLSLGAGAVIVYTSFMKGSDNIGTSGAYTAIFDTLFAVVAGFAVMPAVFAAGIEPGAGPSLVFETLPFIFTNMGAQAPIISRIITIIFFLAIFIAALTSSISMMAVCVEHVIEHRGISRKKACTLFFVGAWILGALCSLSFGILGDIKIVGQNIFGFCDALASNFFMTLTALAISIFVGWRMGKANVRDEFTNGGTLRFNCAIFDILYYLVKWVVPVMILIIFLSNFVN